MPWLLRPKTGEGAAVCSYAQRIQEPFPLTGRTALIKQLVLMEQKMLAWYGLRWNIEFSYYEGKTFWSMEEYHIRSREGIERLINLISLSYSAMTLLPYSDETFSGCQSASAQETRYEIGQQIQSEIILCSFGKYLETIKNCSILKNVVESYILSGFKKLQKL